MTSKDSNLFSMDAGLSGSSRTTSGLGTKTIDGAFDNIPPFVDGLQPPGHFDSIPLWFQSARELVSSTHGLSGLTVGVEDHVGNAIDWSRASACEFIVELWSDALRDKILPWLASLVRTTLRTRLVWLSLR
jgi:hypothetical protein